MNIILSLKNLNIVLSHGGGGVSEEQCGFMFRKSTTEVMLALRVLMTLNIWDQPSKRTDSAQERK